MKVSLHTSALASQAHEAVFMPWLKEVAATAAISPRPTAVLVPQRADGYFLKSRALGAGIGLWGVHFLTPSDLRDRISHHLRLSMQIPLREHLRLLLGAAAERVAGGGTTAAVALAPDQLLKTIDTMGGAGWDFAQAGPPRLRPLVAEFHHLLDQAGWKMMHDADRAALAAARGAAPCLAKLFVIGFNASHWPSWPLLEAAVRLAEESVICLTEPRVEGEDLDMAWIGTWEETFGPAQTVAAEAPPSALAGETQRLPESKAERAEREASPVGAIEFLVGTDTEDHARAVVAKAIAYLADPSCERLGILFPSAGALPRRVAALLAELSVAHHDGLAYQGPGPLETPDWPAWLALQESPRLPTLRRFLRRRADLSFAGLPVEMVVSELQRAYQELLIDDLAVLAEYLAGHPLENLRALSTALRALPSLPERATLGEFFQRTTIIFRNEGWTEREEALQRLTAGWKGSLDLGISRRIWLRWLDETLVSWRAQRAEAGSHPYSRLHLVSYSHAESQAWTHLIATGLNEGQWPPTFEEAGFLGEEEITALNFQTRTRNTRVSVQGRQGEGHIALPSGQTLCLGPAQRRALVERQFLNTLESATVGVTATMQLRDEAAPERPLNPSAFFTRLHLCARGRSVSQQTLVSLHTETLRWLEAMNLWKKPAPDSEAVRPTRAAFDARRAAGLLFGEYEFALRGAPRTPLRLAATQWENVLPSPAPTFLAVVLGVSADRSDEETPWALAQGVWVHRWLKALTGSSTTPPTLVPLPAPAELRQRLRTAADNSRGLAAAALLAQGRTVPDWWQSAWQQAWSAAAQLAESVAAVQGRSHAATEWSIRDTPLPFDGRSLYVRGRIDLLLSTSATLEDLWLVDYKTGDRRALRTKDLEAGQGVQLALYALALRAAGAREVGISLLTPGASLDQPQIQLPALDELTGLWRGLLQVQETGVFGMLGALRQEFGRHQDYPLATLAIDEDVLADKWERTHPHFAIAETDS